MVWDSGANIEKCCFRFVITYCLQGLGIGQNKIVVYRGETEKPIINSAKPMVLTGEALWHDPSGYKSMTSKSMPKK